ncbi:MAG: hypothetical protein L0Y68_04835 [Candidatus Dadabacteria bacterium]|nr:hypothetical protein [Candidatus Dadabacteria bacterium]
MQSKKVIIGVFAWFLLAIAAGKYRLLTNVPPPFPQVVLFGLTLILLLLFWKWSVFRNWALKVDIRALLLVHLFRFIGIYFLILHSRGELPYAFAVPGGLGDIAIAIVASLLLFISPERGGIALKAFFIWNLLGLLDILFVVATAGRLWMADPASMSALTKLPLSLLLTFLVPIIIFTHIVIFVRLFKPRSKS